MLFSNRIFNLMLFVPSLLINSVRSFNTPHPRGECTIKICHNKHCTKKGGGDTLLQTFRDLIPAVDSYDGDGKLYDSDVSVEKSGCLSQCDRGPNICIVNDKNEEKLYVGISDPTTASAILEVVTEMDYPIALLLAATMINDAQQATKPSKKEQLLTSAIEAISKEENDATIQNSYAHAHALFLRADAFLEMTPPNIDCALTDARQSVKIAPRERKAWRVLACAEEAGGNYSLAINALREVARLDPSFATKARNEIDRLVSIGE